MDISKQDADAMNELSVKSFETHMGFLKTVGAVSITLFGIVVGTLTVLQKISPSGELPFQIFLVRVFFCLSLCTLALGILGVYTCLYSFVLAHRALADQYAGKLLQIYSNNTSHGNATVTTTKDVSTWYTYAGKFGLLSLMVSVICFAAYAVIIIWN